MIENHAAMQCSLWSNDRSTRIRTLDVPSPLQPIPTVPVLLVVALMAVGGHGVVPDLDRLDGVSLLDIAALVLVLIWGACAMHRAATLRTTDVAQSALATRPVSNPRNL